MFSGLELRFEIVEIIGSGGFGRVFRAIDRLTGLDCALKELRHPMNADGDAVGGMSKATLRDVGILKELAHPNIVRLLDTFHTPHALYLVMELMEQDLAVLLYGPDSRGDLSAGVVKRFMRQLCEGLGHCHAHMVMHRDIKPHNLLVDTATRTLKIGDFGLARMLNPSPFRATYSPFGGTLWYRAPELILGSESYSLSVDLWAVGCVFAEMANRRPLFRGISEDHPTAEFVRVGDHEGRAREAKGSEIEVLFTIFKTLGTPDDSVWPGVTGLPGFQAEFPKWPPPVRLAGKPAFGAQGLLLLSVSLKRADGRTACASKTCLDLLALVSLVAIPRVLSAAAHHV